VFHLQRFYVTTYPPGIAVRTDTLAFEFYYTEIHTTDVGDEGKIYVSCDCYLCLISVFEVEIHVCSCLHYKLVTDPLASVVLEEMVTQNCLSWAQCRYCNHTTPNQPIKKFCGHIK